MFKDLVYLLIAAGAANASPLGPDACPSSISPYEYDPVKGWWGVTWVNGDSTAYTYFTEDGGSSVSHQVSPGATSLVGTGWTLADINSGDIQMKHVKNGIDDSCGWQTVSVA